MTVLDVWEGDRGRCQSRTLPKWNRQEFVVAVCGGWVCPFVGEPGTQVVQAGWGCPEAVRVDSQLQSSS